jgi:aspartate/methionine/tyrosine aminotransferase
MRKLSRSTENLAGQKMFQILTRAKELENQGKSIIHLEIGDPDFESPPNVVEKCIQELRDGNTHYVSASGSEEFKAAAAERTFLSRGFKPSYEQILVTQGANIQIFYCLATIADPGDEIITVDPCFVSYRSIIDFLGLKGIYIPLQESNNFKLDPNELEKVISSKTKAILINSPHNPTGSVLGEAEMKQIYALAEKYDLFLLSDEVYGRMIFEENFFSPSSIDHCKDRTVIIHSFSKSYAMTGWRIGAVTGPEKLIKKMTLVLETLNSCVPPFIQSAATEAIISDQIYIKNMISEFKERRDLIYKCINSIDFLSCIKPEGAFYLFVNIKETGLNDVTFSQRLLDEHGVATCPGSYFGKSGEGYVRLCFANSKKNILSASERIENFIKDLE